MTNNKRRERDETIKKRYANGEAVTDLGREYDLSERQVRRILKAGDL